MRNVPTVAENHNNTGLEPQQIDRICEILKHTLADTYTLLVKTHNYHWNVSGMHWMQLHELFEKQYKELFKAADEVAEQIRKLGGVAPGSMKEFMNLSSLREQAGKFRAEKEMIADLQHDHEAICRQLREAIEEVDDKCNDTATADFLTERLRAHDEMAWKLRSHLEPR